MSLASSAAASGAPAAAMGARLSPVALHFLLLLLVLALALASYFCCCRKHAWLRFGSARARRLRWLQQEGTPSNPHANANPNPYRSSPNGLGGVA